MEVIIDYYGEDYPFLIRPDKSVMDNKLEIAVSSKGLNESSRKCFQWKMNIFIYI